MHRDHKETPREIAVGAAAYFRDIIEEIKEKEGIKDNREAAHRLMKGIGGHIWESQSSEYREKAIDQILKLAGMQNKGGNSMFDIEIKKPSEFLEQFEKAYMEGRDIIYKGKSVLTLVVGVPMARLRSNVYIDTEFLFSKMTTKDLQKLKDKIQEIWELQQEEIETKAHLSGKEMKHLS